MNPLLAIVVSNHPMLREGICHSLERTREIRIVDATGPDEKAVAAVANLAPDVVIMDLGSSQFRAATIVKQIKLSRPKTTVVAIVENKKDTRIPDLIGAGVTGLALGTGNAVDLVQTIHGACSGRLVVDSTIGREIIGQGYHNHVDHGANVASRALTPRQREILGMVAKGMRNKEVAAELSVSNQTVKNHLAAILSKLAVRTRTEAVIVAMKRGWLSSEGVGSDQHTYSFSLNASKHAWEAGFSGQGGAVTAACPDCSPGGCQAAFNGLLEAGDECWHLLDEIGQGVLLIRQDEFAFANREAANMLGYGKQELVGLPFLEVMPTEVRQQMWRLHLRRLAGDRVPGQCSANFQRKDGSRITASVLAKVVLHERQSSTLVTITSWGKKVSAFSSEN